jgi:uncharacterized SAM-dependent methyltransferase
MTSVVDSHLDTDIPRTLAEDVLDGLTRPAKELAPKYDDSAGVTAEFNRNVLLVLNRELGADFDPALFDHVAFYDPAREWIEMRLRARRAHTVHIPAVNLELSAWMTDPEERFALSLSRRRR